MLNFKDGIWETSTSQGNSGNIVLLGAQTNFDSFASRYAANTSRIPVIRRDTSTAWESLICTLTAGGELQVDDVVRSSDGTTRIDWPAGTRNVFVPYSMQEFQQIVGLGFEIVDLVSSGSPSGEVYPATSLAGPRLYREGMRLMVLPDADSLAGAVIDLDTLGEKALRTIDGAAAGAGALVKDRLAELVYDGTGFRISGAGGVAAEIARVSFSGTPSAVDFDVNDYPSMFDDTYFKVWIAYRGVRPGTDGAGLLLRTSSDGGSTFDAGANDYGYAYGDANTSSSSFVVSGAATSIALNNGVGNTSTYGAQGFVEFMNPNNASGLFSLIHQSFNAFTATAPRASFGGGHRKSSALVDGIRFVWTAGNFATDAGEFVVYGYR